VGTALGAIVGAGVGSFLSGFFGPSIEEQRADCWKDLRPDVAEALDTLRNKAQSAYEAALVEAEGTVENVVAEYFKQYERLVSEMVSADDKEARVLEQIRDQLDSDREELALRKAAVDGWREALKRA